MDINPAGLDLAEIENVVDEIQQMVGAGVDVLEILILTLVNGARILRSRMRV